MGIHQLRRLGDYWHKRQTIWNTYNEAFKNLPCFLPPSPQPDSIHAYHLYTPMIDIDELGKNRDWVLDAMTAENIGMGVHYVPIHLHPFYRKMFGWQKGQFPNAEWIGERTISLPLSAGLDKNDVEDVCRAFCKVIIR